jgi:hypothetical protein
LLWDWLVADHDWKPSTLSGYRSTVKFLTRDRIGARARWTCLRRWWRRSPRAGGGRVETHGVGALASPRCTAPSIGCAPLAAAAVPNKLEMCLASDGNRDGTLSE